MVSEVNVHLRISRVSRSISATHQGASSCPRAGTTGINPPEATHETTSADRPRGCAGRPSDNRESWPR